MEHTDPDALALVALGEPLTDPGVVDHLTNCASCRREIETLRSTVSVARSAIGETKLHVAPARVWHAVRSELGLSTDLEPPTAATTLQRPARQGEPAAVVQLDAERERRSIIRRMVMPIVASAAAAALVAGGVLWWGASEPRDAGQLIASAQLDALPDWPQTSGQATIAELADGERVVTVSLDAEVDADVVREVWLLTENVDGLISLGLLTGTTGRFVVPASVDLAEYSVVDISAEPLDGDPTHSGNSIVRGGLDV